MQWESTYIDKNERSEWYFVNDSHCSVYTFKSSGFIYLFGTRCTNETKRVRLVTFVHRQSYIKTLDFTALGLYIEAGFTSSRTLAKSDHVARTA